MPSAALKRRRKKERQADRLRLTRKDGVQAAPAPAPATQAQDLWKLRAAPFILLAVVTSFVFYQALHNPFANYDDPDYVIENDSIHHGLSLSTLKWAFTSISHANWHPLTWISHSLDWRLFGPDAWGHHLTSLLLHVANVLLLFFLLDRTTGQKLRSLVVAGLFAVHPINVESVVWISERKNVLCMLFFLLTLLAYAYFAQRPTILRYLLVAFAFMLGLASKPMLVTVPFVLLLMDYWPLQRIRGWTPPAEAFPVPQAPPWRLILEKVPLLLFSVADSIVTLIAQKSATALRPVAKFPLKDRIANAVISYADYLWKLLWPAKLAIFYQHPAGHLKLWLVALCALLLAGVSVWVWRERSHPYLITGWFWFLGTLIPVIGLIQVGDQGMADRYMYLPAIGIFVMAVWGLAELGGRIPRKMLSYAQAGFAVVFLSYSIASVAQVRVWRTTTSLWTRVLEVNKNNATAEVIVGSDILTNAQAEGRQYSDEALVHFQNALKIDPKNSEALLNVGADLQSRGKVREALEQYKVALEYADDAVIKYRIFTDMGSAYEDLKDFESARDYYRQALAMGHGRDSTAFVGFARTFTDEQIQQVKKSLANKPDAPTYFQLGQLQEAGAYNSDAVASYQQALVLDPNLDGAKSALVRLSRTVR